jgi:hypothetical protein
MRFENISHELKCILFEKYGFLFLKSPIHVYQYEMPVLHASAILSLILTRPNYVTSRAPRLDLGIRNNTIIRSGMKSILNFCHNIEKYGFKCLEFGNPHPCGRVG